VKRGELPFDRSFARPSVRSFVRRRGVKENTMWMQKSGDEGKKEQNKGQAEKKLL
jgi:hypothetical protein